MTVLADDGAQIDEPLDDLLDEERVSLGFGQDLRSQGLRELGDLEEAADQLSALGIGQRTEGERGCVAAPRRELGMRLGELGPRRGEQDERPFRTAAMR